MKPRAALAEHGCQQQGWQRENSSWLLGRVGAAVKDEEERVCFTFDNWVYELSVLPAEMGRCLKAHK